MSEKNETKFLDNNSQESLKVNRVNTAPLSINNEQNIALTLEIKGDSHVGQKRKLNEDAVGVFRGYTHLGNMDQSYALAIVADGMGGHEGGEIASALAMATLYQELGDWLICPGFQWEPQEAEQVMREAVKVANQNVYELGQDPAFQNSGKKPGTTLNCGLFIDRQVLIANVGDSRCYRLRGNTLDLLTRDHSMAQNRIDKGEMTEEEARTWKYSNVLLACLGMEQMENCDIQCREVQPGDLFLFCSDGLSGMIPREELSAVLQEQRSLDEMVASLIERANQYGGKDNISVILVRASISTKEGK